MATRSKKSRTKKTAINEHGHVIQAEDEPMDFSSNGTFDVNKYTVGNAAQEVTLLVGPDQDELTLTIQDLSWSKRNRLMSQCLSWDATGNTSFDGDSYVRLCLKEMITEAPWGPTTEAFLIRITNDLGAALESLVPRAFDNSELGTEVEGLKKER